jgi:hypothetical protein
MTRDSLPLRPRLSRRAMGAGLLAAGVLFTLGCRAAVPVRAAAARVELVKTPNGGIQPQAVTDSRGTLHLVYFKGEPRAGDLFYQRRAPGQSAWSEPVRVNSQPGSAIAMGTIRGGHLAVGKGNRVHVVWFGASQSGGGHGGAPLLYTRLADGGTAFEPQRNLMQFTTMLDGGGSVAADPGGSVYVAFHAGDGKTEGEGNRRLWVARSKDDGKTFSREAPAWSEPTGACACCSTKAFADSKGVVYALYRSAAAKVNRDMYLLTSADQGATFQGAAVDQWKVAT